MVAEAGEVGHPLERGGQLVGVGEEAREEQREEGIEHAREHRDGRRLADDADAREDGGGLGKAR